MVFKQINTSDRNLQTIQGNVDAALKQIQISSFLNGNLIEGIRFSPVDGSATINHKLGRQPKAWLIMDITQDPTSSTAPASVYRYSWDDKTIKLVAGQPCQISIWVS